MRLTDIHCHLLPGIDDGPRSVDETKVLLQEMRKTGVERMIATPHYRPGMFEVSVREIRERYEEIKALARDMEMELYLGCEYYRDSQIPRRIRAEQAPTMGESRYVLVEFEPEDSFGTLRNQTYALYAGGWKVIIAHIERYKCCRDVERVRELIDLGAYIQVNAGAVLGQQGIGAQLYCRKIMRQNLVTFIASDTHDMKGRNPNLGRCVTYVTKKFGTKYARRIFEENPENILRSGERHEEVNC